MKTLKENQIRAGLYDLAALVEIPVEDLKEEFEKTVEAISGKNATFLGDDKEQNMQLQTGLTHADYTYICMYESRFLRCACAAMMT